MAFLNKIDGLYTNQYKLNLNLNLLQIKTTREVSRIKESAPSQMKKNTIKSVQSIFFSN